MYVCICNGITEKDLKDAIESGAKSLQDLIDMTGAASSCGSCTADCDSLIKENGALQLIWNSVPEIIYHARLSDGSHAAMIHYYSDVGEWGFGTTRFSTKEGALAAAQDAVNLRNGVE